MRSVRVGVGDVEFFDEREGLLAVLYGIDGVDSVEHRRERFVQMPIMGVYTSRDTFALPRTVTMRWVVTLRTVWCDRLKG